MTINPNHTYGPRALISDRDGTIHRVHGPMAEERARRFDECIADVAAVIDASDLAIAQMTPAEQARAAWHPGSTKTVAELEAEIRAERGLPPKEGDVDA